MSKPKAEPPRPAPASAPAPAQAAEEWDEERLEQALETLKSLHIQLREMRGTVPRLTAPLFTKHPSAEAFFAAYTKSITEANREVADLKTAMKSDETTQVLEHATESRRKDPKDIKPWRYKDHPDWFRKDN